MEQLLQNNKCSSSDDVFDDEEPLPHNFRNAFTWKHVYVSIEDIENTHQRLTGWEDFIDMELLGFYRTYTTDWSFWYERWIRFSPRMSLMPNYLLPEPEIHQNLKVKYYD